MKSIFFMLIPIFGIAACGGSVFDGTTNGGGGDGGGGGGGSDGGSTGNDGGLESVGCPPVEPTSGNCSPSGIQCEYGSNNGTCGDPYVDCQNGQWVQQIVPGVACLPNDTCPASQASIVDGQNCGNEELECNYAGQGRCTCAPQGFGGLQPYNPDGGPLPNVWECEQPTSGCSVDRPRLGSACSAEGQSCPYGDCSMPDSIIIQCSGGVWVNAPFACAG